MILTEQEISEIPSFPWERTVDFVRRVEARIEEKLKAQEPFGYFRAEAFCWTDCAETDEGAKPLYEHPLPPADVVRDAERYKWLRKVAPNIFWDSHDKEIGFVRFDTKAYLWKPEIFDAAIDAAMKGDAA